MRPEKDITNTSSACVFNPEFFFCRTYLFYAKVPTLGPIHCRKYLCTSNIGRDYGIQYICVLNTQIYSQSNLKRLKG